MADRRETFCTAEEAAQALSVSVSTFKRIVGASKKVWSIELPGVREWCRPVAVGDSPRWLWADIDCIAHILSRRAGAAPPEEAE